MLVITVLLVCLLGITSAKAAGAARALGLPPVLTAGIVLAAVVYVSCLAPGAFGMLATGIVYTLCAVLCLGLLIALARFVPHDPSRDDPSRGSDIRLTAPDVLVTAIGIVGAVPMLEALRWTLPSRLLDPAAPLPWDTVSYHLPGFIEFWQNRSLWSLDGPYQSYSYAFELIGNFLSHPYAAHWGLYVAHALAIALLVAAIASVARAVVRGDSASSPAWLPTAMLAVGLWSTALAPAFRNVGKNDIFMAACLVAALGFLLRVPTNGSRSDADPWAPVVLAAVALGLALGTKPTALAFVPFFAIVTAFVIPRDATAGRQRKIVGASLMVGVSLLLGGFWLLRNLVTFGQLSPLDRSWRSSLLANLTNPAVYETEVGSVLFAIGLLAVVPGLVLVRRGWRDPALRRSRALLVAFHLVACGAFAMTPHAIFRHDLTVSAWQLRLGMPLFASAALIYALVMRSLLARLFRQTARRRAVALGGLAVLLVVGALLRWNAAPPVGMTGHDRVKGLPPTGLYAWIHRQPTPLRIYAAGVRPYGLYGPGWKNTLFYDLHSTQLAKRKTGTWRIAAVTVGFEPDLIIVAVDPHPYTGDAAKPETTTWMRARTADFEEVYSDETASVFRVKPGAGDRLGPLIPPGYRLYFGG